MDFTVPLEQYGLPGIIILGMGWALFLLWNRLNTVQDARLAEAHEHTKQILEMTGQFKDLGHDSIRSMAALTDVVKESLRNG